MEIDGFLQSIDIEKHYAEHDPPRSGEDEILLLFENHFGPPQMPPSRVYWFHLTRALPKSDFAQGIKPLHDALDVVWETIFEVFAGSTYEEGLKKLRREGVPDRAYTLKLSNPVHGGPYAMLVRDAAFSSQEMGNHDYLAIPEIMEDISNGYHAVYGEFIHDQLREALSPCVVKFWSKTQMGGCIEAAMYYLYCTANNRPLTICANTCYDGGNETVSSKQIVKVDFLMP